MNKGKFSKRTYSKWFGELFTKRNSPEPMSFSGSLHLLTDTSPCLVHASATVTTCVTKAISYILRLSL